MPTDQPPADTALPAPPSPPVPPAAPRRTHPVGAHGDERVDDWYWLRDRADPEVLALLEAENDYTAAMTAHTEALRKELYEEIVARILETDLSVPAKRGEWWYLSRTEEGKQYPMHCRRRGGPDGDEDTVLDQNELAAGHEFFALGALAPSTGQSLLAFSTDTTGAERYTMRVKDLTTAALLDDVVEDTYYGVGWSADDRHLFYVRPDRAMRPYQLWRHRLGEPAGEDVLVFQEDDDRFYVSVRQSKSERYLFLSLHSKVTSEVWFLETGDPLGRFRLLAAREQDVEYEVEDHGERFFIVTNADGAENFKLVEAPTASPGREHWRDVVGHRPDVKLDGIEVFARHLVLFERAEGLSRLRVRRLSDGAEHVVDQPEPVYTVSGQANHELDTDVLRFGYQSMVTPASVFDYDMESRERTLLKQQPVLGGYDPSGYETARLWATAADGTRVPISIVHRRGLALDGTNPALLYGYGSYEMSRDPTFSSIRLNLLDRGFVYAIAHVRGGGELGRRWYEDGKLLHKRNTFTDFVACAEHLVAAGYSSPARLAIQGGSAGGLLVGAAVNLRPDLFGAVVAEVPFVDCLTTIMDETLPLTVIEWEEWGNPVTDPAVYEYMRSYAPYDNVAPAPYPAMLVTAGLNDPRVSYWEPAKWAQKLRAVTTGDRPILLKVELGAGHMGPSGRYDVWRDEAFIHAFLLDVLAVSST